MLGRIMLTSVHPGRFCPSWERYVRKIAVAVYLVASVDCRKRACLDGMRRPLRALTIYRMVEGKVYR